MNPGLRIRPLVVTDLPVYKQRRGRRGTRWYLPAREQTIVLAMDVSLSMRATDVIPDRIGASQRAAKAFVSQLQRRADRRGVIRSGLRSC